MKEYEVIKIIDEAFEAIGQDPEAQFRVLDWAVKKFGRGKTSLPVTQDRPDREKSFSGYGDSNASSATTECELPGIAVISDSGEFKLTVRDLKARNTNDAAIRLALVSILAYCKLTGEKSASSRRIVKPILEDWRAYTGNTRRELAMHQGILRDGDLLSLDQHAKREAETFIAEILDPELSGRWQPSGRKRPVVGREKRPRSPNGNGTNEE